MPLAGLYTTPEVQDKLIHGIQDVIIRSSHKIHRLKTMFRYFNFLSKVSAFFETFIILAELIRVAYRIWKLPSPAHDNVNRFNSHTMIDLRDWFLRHDKSERNHWFYEVFFNLVIIKYEVDGHMGKRFDKWLEKWLEAYQEGKWLFTHKHPATEWVLDSDDMKDPEVIRQKALLEAWDKKEWSKVMNLVD